MTTILKPLLLFPLAGLLICGCSRNAHSKADVERARQSLEKVLDSWKSGDLLVPAKAPPDGVDFSDDDLKAGRRLIDYQVLKSDASDPAVIRCTVHLTLQDRKGQNSEREATYSIALKSPLAIARDPYY